MNCFCISLPEKTELRERLSNLQEHFGDKFAWFDGVRLTETEWKNLVLTNYISPQYKGGRRDFKELIGECGAWVAHRNLWKHIATNKIKKALIVEDGSVFNPDIFNETDYDKIDKQIIFVNDETRQEKNKLTGFGLNGYIISYKTANKLLELTKSIIMPLDLMVINICNNGFLTWNKSNNSIKKDRTIAHSTSDKLIDQNNDFSSKQDFRTLLERFFLNDINVMKRNKPKLAFAATHFSLGTGYAKIGYELTQHLLNDFEVLYLGFQKTNLNACEDREIDNRITDFDLASLAPNSPGNFGFSAIPKILEDEKPDYLMIYNDCSIITEIIKNNQDYKGKIIAYLDVVYEYQNEDMIKYIRDNVYKTYVFTEYFRTHLIDYHGFQPDKIGVIPHGLNKINLYENPRERFNMNKDDFIVLNINRNSYRKRLEVTIKSFCEFWIKTDFDNRVKLQLSCHLNTPDGLDIIRFLKILAFEYKIEFEKLTSCINITSKPMSLPQDVIDNYYQVANVVTSSSLGEGFGMLAFEGAYYGKHIISTDLPAHKEFLFDYDNVKWINRVGHHYEAGNLRGLLPVYNTNDFTEALHSAYLKWLACDLKENLEYKNIMYERYNWKKVSTDFVQDLLSTN